MISRPTVFVLGAGASRHLGFPLGRQLLLDIIDQGSPPGQGPTGQFLERVGYHGDRVRAFQADLGASASQSVDTFLEHRQEFLDIGKSAIAWHILRCERSMVPSLHRPQVSWYEHLWTLLAARFDEIRLNRVGFVTFNYDRSLEEFLLRAAMALHGKNDGQVVEQLRSIPIVHVHGSTGTLPPFGLQNPLVYGGGPNLENGAAVAGASLGVRIIYEAEAESPAFAEARSLLAGAERVFFLGLSYGRTNLRRLQINSIKTGSVMGSAVGLNGEEQQDVKALFGGRISLHGDCLETLRSASSLSDG